MEVFSHYLGVRRLPVIANLFQMLYFEQIVSIFY